MIFRHLTQILCTIIVINSAVKNAHAISFDDIFEYILDGLDDSDESSEELANNNLNVTCKNCTLSVECHNCTETHKVTQSTVPVQTSTQNNQQSTTSSLPTPTIPAPERVVEIVSSNTVPAASQNLSTSITSPGTAGSPNTKPGSSPQQTASTKSIGEVNQATDDGTSLTTDAILNSSDGVTGGSELTTN